MQLNNWITTLFKIAGRQNILGMFGRRRNNRGMIWATLLGLGVSAAAYSFRKNGNPRWLNPVQNVMNNRQTQNITRMALAEFSKELADETISLNKK